MTKTAATAIKMLESLPEEFQEQVVEKMRGLSRKFVMMQSGRDYLKVTKKA